MILEKALEHKLDEIVFDVDARSLGAFYRRVPKEAFDVYDYFVREADGKCSFNASDLNQDFDEKGSVLSTPPTSPTHSRSGGKSPSSRRRKKKKEPKTKALGFSGALKRAVIRLYHRNAFRSKWFRRRCADIIKSIVISHRFR